MRSCNNDAGTLPTAPLHPPGPPAPHTAPHTAPRRTTLTRDVVQEAKVLDGLEQRALRLLEHCRGVGNWVGAGAGMDKKLVVAGQVDEKEKSKRT